MEDEQELIEHTVEIDEYVSATIRIPKVLTAIDLKALMVKANKLFNLAETKIIDKPRKKFKKLGDGEAEKLVREYSKVKNIQERRELAKKWGMSSDDVSRKVSYLRKKLGLR